MATLKPYQQGGNVEQAVNYTLARRLVNSEINVSRVVRMRRQDGQASVFNEQTSMFNVQGDTGSRSRGRKQALGIQCVWYSSSVRTCNT